MTASPVGGAGLRFAEPLTEARFLRRYKRFLADFALDGAQGPEIVTAHCANPGAMLGLLTPGSRALLSRSTNPARKLAWSWHVVEAELPGGSQWVGIDTALPNRLVAAALAEDRLAPFTGYAVRRAEVAYGRASRVDFLLADEDRPPCYVEVKNCHMMRQPGLAEFPDCVAARSARHMDELAAMAASGARAAAVIVVQMRADRFDVARDIDPAFDRAFRRARAAGVEAYAYSCDVSSAGIAIARPVEIVTPA